MGYKHNKNMLDLTRIQRNQNQNHELFHIIHVGMEIYIKNILDIYINIYLSGNTGVSARKDFPSLKWVSAADGLIYDYLSWNMDGDGGGRIGRKQGKRPQHRLYSQPLGKVNIMENS